MAPSSRNAYLGESERISAVSLPTALKRAVAALENGEVAPQALEIAKAEILKGGFQSVDYVDADTLETMHVNDRSGHLIAAARIGKTRLIDNFPVAAR